MRLPLFLLKAAAKALLNYLGAGVAGDLLCDLVSDAWKWLRGKERDPAPRRPAASTPAEDPQALPGWLAAGAVVTVTGAGAVALILAVFGALWLAEGLSRAAGPADGEDQPPVVVPAVSAAPPVNAEAVARRPAPVKVECPPPGKTEAAPKVPAEAPPQALIEDVAPGPKSAPVEEAELPHLKLDGPPPVKWAAVEAPAIPNYTAIATWRLGATLKGQRVRVSGRAEVKESLEGRFVVWFLGAGGRGLIVAGLEDEGAARIKEELVKGVGVGDVRWELTVEGVVGRVGAGTMTLDDITVVKAEVARGRD